MITRRLKSEIFICCLLFFWPFVFLFKHTLGRQPWSLGIGNDFKILYYDYKVYLLDHLASFRFPLWSPGEGAGYPFWTNPFSQVLYPLNPLLTIFYKVMGGLSLQDYQLFTISGIGIFAVGLYLWLRSLGYPAYIGIVTSLIFSVSFKITELIRFPNAVHTAAWIPFLLMGINLAARSAYSRLAIKIIFAATLFLLTAGYPYYLVYLIFLVLPMIGIELIHSKQRVKYLLILVISVVTAIILLVPYGIGITQLLSGTTDRTGNSFFFSTKQNFTLTDTFGSLIMPPAAQTEGWFYFGQTALWVIAAGLIWTFLNIRKRPMPVIGLFLYLTWVGIISWITYGKESGLFTWLWKNIPGVASLRVWGRMNIILVPLLSWLFAKCLHLLMTSILRFDMTRVIKVFAIVLIIYGFEFEFQIRTFTSASFDHYWVSYFPTLDPQFFIRMGIISLVAFAFIIFNLRKRLLVIFSLLIVCLWDLSYVSTRQWSFLINGNINYYQRQVLHLAKTKMATFQNPRTYSYFAVPLTHSYSVGYLDNWYFYKYIDFLKQQGVYGLFDKELPDNFRELMGINNGQRIFFVTQIDEVEVDDFLTEAKKLRESNLAIFKVEFYSGEKLKVNVQTQVAGYLAFIDSWDPDWEVWVDGKPRDLRQLFGSFKAVRVFPEDKSVEFVYRPGWLKFLSHIQSGINEN